MPKNSIVLFSVILKFPTETPPITPSLTDYHSLAASGPVKSNRGCGLSSAITVVTSKRAKQHGKWVSFMPRQFQINLGSPRHVGDVRCNIALSNKASHSRSNTPPISEQFHAGLRRTISSARMSI